MDGGQHDTQTQGPVPVTEGEWAGWSVWRDIDAYEDLTGPYFFRREADGAIRCAMRCQAKHLNSAGNMHGGAIMTFADFCLFVIAQDIVGPNGVTATMNCEFVGAISPGDLIETTGEIVRGGRSLVFVRGLMRVAGAPVLSWSGVIKRVTVRQG